MVITAGDLRDAGISVPLLVGGAALSEKFTRGKIAPAYDELVCYAKDAMTGLRLMNQVMDPGPARGTAARAAGGRSACTEAARGARPRRRLPARSAVRKCGRTFPIPPAPYLERKVRDVPHLAEVWSYINPSMLYGRHLGYKGNFEKDLAAHVPKALELFHDMEEMKAGCGALHEGQSRLAILRSRARPECHSPVRARRRFAHSHFPIRPAASRGRALPERLHSGCGERPRSPGAVSWSRRARAFARNRRSGKHAGEYLKAHGLQALAIETAEGCAEWLHRRIREDWGFPDSPSMTMQERFTSRYRGKRYSFGYPACPNLDDQQGIWKLLRPDEIGVQLTEGMMMEPEASVSALVFHHPDCAYFTAAEEVEVGSRHENIYDRGHCRRRRGTGSRAAGQARARKDREEVRRHLRVSRISNGAPNIISAGAK